MKKFSLYLSFCISLVLFNGCQSKAASGAVVGGGIGAGTGAIVAGGHGAIIGGAVGIVTGASIGYALDQSEKSKIESSDPKTLRHIDQGERLSVHDIIVLHQAGVSDDKIKDLIKKTNSTYTLNTRDVHKLESAGVSSDVINYMMKNRR